MHHSGCDWSGSPIFCSLIFLWFIVGMEYFWSRLFRSFSSAKHKISRQISYRDSKLSRNFTHAILISFQIIIEWSPRELSIISLLLVNVWTHKSRLLGTLTVDKIFADYGSEKVIVASLFCLILVASSSGRNYFSKQYRGKCGQVGRQRSGHILSYQYFTQSSVNNQIFSRSCENWPIVEEKKRSKWATIEYWFIELALITVMTILMLLNENL